MTRPAILAAMLLAGCASAPPANPIRSVRVMPFQCVDPVVGEAVRNIVLGTLSKHSSARIARDGEAEVVVEGTVTMLSGSSGTGRVAGLAYGGNAGVGGRYQSTGGDWVSGVTALVLRNGEILTTAAWAQELNSDALRPPEEVAREAASELLSALRSKGLPK